MPSSAITFYEFLEHIESSSEHTDMLVGFKEGRGRVAVYRAIKTAQGSGAITHTALNTMHVNKMSYTKHGINLHLRSK